MRLPVLKNKSPLDCSQSLAWRNCGQAGFHLLIYAFTIHEKIAFVIILRVICAYLRGAGVSGAGTFTSHNNFSLTIMCDIQYNNSGVIFMPEGDQLQSYITELRRGSLTIAVLGSLKTPRYGYALLQTLQESGVGIEGNTLYPLLRRLESHGLLSSDWDTSESRPRKYYVTNDAGEQVLAGLMIEWRKMGESLSRICGGNENDV